MPDDDQVWSREKCITYLEDMSNAWEQEHGIPYLIILERVVNSEILDYSIKNIEFLIKHEKRLLGWKI